MKSLADLALSEPTRQVGDPGKPPTYTRQLGPLTVFVQGQTTSSVPWLALVLLNGQPRLGRLPITAKDIGSLTRFPVQLWDFHHERWAKKRTLDRGRLLGLVRADDPGLNELGIERWKSEPKSRLIAIGV